MIFQTKLFWVKLSVMKKKFIKSSKDVNGGIEAIVEKVKGVSMITQQKIGRSIF